MNILIAPDKFKGSLSAKEVSDAIAQGWRAHHPHDQITSIPMADGGEGTCDLLTDYFQGKKITLEVTDPQFETIQGDYGISQDGKLAFIEMAKVSGLLLVKPENRNPLLTTTLGTGELIRDALDRKVKKIILGIGGSGTNDAGMGMLQALGIKFYDKNKKELKPVGASLVQLKSIHANHMHAWLKEVEFIALCDVDNPLHGPRGAAFTYAPQKGASETEVQLLDDGLRNFEQVVKQLTHVNINFPGAGAGGGLPGGAKAFLHISVLRGMDFMIETTRLEEKVKEADLIFTGEGKIDQQTLSGKVVHEVGKLGMKYKKPVVAITGQCELSGKQLQPTGISKVISLTDLYSREAAIKNAFALIKESIAAEN